MNNNIEKAIRKLHLPLFVTRNATREFWIHQHKHAPNYKLIEKNIFRQTLKKDDTITLVSAMTVNSELVKKCGYILPGNGCLAGAIYTVQAYPAIDATTVTLHNFGTNVMKFKGYEGLTPYIFKVDVKKTKISPINYLAMGDLFNQLRNGLHIQEESDSAELDAYVHNGLDVAMPLINNCVQRYKKRIVIDNYVDAMELLSKTAITSSVFRSLSYVYFEAVSLGLGLYSEDKKSKELKSKGELNNEPYIELNDMLQRRRIQKRFASYGFYPTPQELLKLLTELQKNEVIRCSFQKLIIAVANNIIFYVGSSLNTVNDVQGMLFHDYCSARETEKGYLTKLEKSVAKNVTDYWRKNNISIVYNSTFEKGEIGITPCISRDNIEIWHGVYERDLRTVQKVEKIQVSIREYGSV